MALTEHRDLRTGRPVWMAYRTPIARPQRLRRDLETDVLVVGAGISGILIAHSLASAGKRVTLVDRRGAVMGSTAASTALLQFEIDTPLIELQRVLGVRKARAAWLRSLAALRSLRATIDSTKIQAAAAVRPSVLLAGPSLDAKALAAEVRARRRIGLPSELLSRRELRARFTLRRSAAIVSQENLEVNPRALAAGLLRRAMKKGVRLYAPHEIVEVEPGTRRVMAHTRDGRTIESAHLVFCTGYEMLKRVPAQGHRIASTWVMATRPQPRALWPQRALLWEAADPYLYARTTADGRVICGGEDEAFSDAETRDAAIAAKTIILQRKLAAMLPDIDATADYSWAGSFGGSDNGLPSIGAVPGHPRCHAVLGYGGNGITFSMLAAEMLTAAILGRPDPDASLFAFR